MVSSGIRRALKIAAALLPAAAGAPGLVLAAEADTSAARQRQLIDTIQEILSRDGPYSPTLLEPLTALIVLYGEDGDDSLAAVAIERARQVVRINEGLHTLEQVPYVQQLVRIERERGNSAAAWDFEQELLALVRRYPGDLRTVPVLREAAERNMSVLAAYLRGERPPELYLGCYYGGPAAGTGDCDSGQRKTVVQGMVADAQRSYSEAIAVLLRNELYDSDELRDMELELLRGVDLVRRMNADDWGRLGSAISPISGGYLASIHQLANWDLPYFGSASASGDGPRHATRPNQVSDTYHRGRQSLQRLYAYDVAGSRPLLSQVNALVQMADWELLHSNNGNAVDGYELMLAALKTAGVPQPRIDEIFLPQIPVVLPAFAPNPFVRDETQQAAGHVDVAFEITKYGRGRAIDILDAANASRRAQDRLVSLIVASRFRPRPTNGEFRGATRVVARYYVYDDAPPRR